MARLLIVLAAVYAASCARTSSPLKDILPVQVQRTWTLEEAKVLPNDEAPAAIRAQGLQRAVSAVYRGNGRIRLRVFEMGGETSAFELIQKWRQTDGLAFYKGKYFVVGETNDADRATLSGFLQALQREIK
jgi:hypothetical protein